MHRTLYFIFKNYQNTYYFLLKKTNIIKNIEIINLIPAMYYDYFISWNIFNKYSLQNFKSNLSIQYLNILAKTIRILVF